MGRINIIEPKVFSFAIKGACDSAAKGPNSASPLVFIYLFIYYLWGAQESKLPIYASSVSNSQTEVHTWKCTQSCFIPWIYFEEYKPSYRKIY